MSEDLNVSGGVITAADLYRKMEDLRVNVTVALEKLADHRMQVSDHEARMRALERFRYSLMGGAITAGVLAGSASGILSAIITTHP